MRLFSLLPPILCVLKLIDFLIMQNTDAQTSDASQLIPQHNYKLDVHALNTRHPGEV